jgi:hypothetical protein|tara:strand:- start:2 stop:124 length:123 start_codon:yes stop_codon:yes gene_type:complete
MIIYGMTPEDIKKAVKGFVIKKWKLLSVLLLLFVLVFIFN